MGAYVKGLTNSLEGMNALSQEQERAKSNAARQRLTPLEDRLARVLDKIPDDVQREGLSLASLQTSLKGRWRGNCHPGELGGALRKLGYRRRRLWRDSQGFRSLWFPE